MIKACHHPHIWKYYPYECLLSYDNIIHRKLSFEAKERECTVEGVIESLLRESLDRRELSYTYEPSPLQKDAYVFLVNGRVIGKIHYGDFTAPQNEGLVAPSYEYRGIFVHIDGVQAQSKELTKCFEQMKKKYNWIYWEMLNIFSKTR